MSNLGDFGRVGVTVSFLKASGAGMSQLLPTVSGCQAVFRCHHFIANIPLVVSLASNSATSLGMKSTRTARAYSVADPML